ncbi:cysteine-rich RLK (RECEPTOR-like protein kinase) 8 [Striga hermonthica]|uniref:Cysteine-rich RLK (RECEPTOR-like protein kinase) 8 n=1 Tax=Striga hermonthica TaxID=68872 RepID=A0A9N7R6R3_STRHE|nr:cysteine-rich RLK (RECEPTOR-like protein kinase) 8 [Striga hermonthica]
MYYMTFVDDCTRKVWVYFLKRKFEAFDTFRRWRALVEKETGLEVKYLRSDNGGEYNSEAIKEYCTDHGIRMQKTVPGTPQQNGIAERMNRTLNERARCMRLKSGMPKIIMRPADSVGAQIDEIERTEEEAEPESDEPIAESSTPLALGREPRMRRAPDRWVYRVKEESDGTKRYKARIVVKGFQQRYGIDFTDVFTPVVKLTTIRLVLSMVAAKNFELQ